MKYVRSIICLICILIVMAALPVTADETEPDPGSFEPAAPDLSSYSGTEAASEAAPETNVEEAVPAAVESAALPAAEVPQTVAEVQTEITPESEEPGGPDTDPMFGLRVGEEITIRADILFEQTRMLMADASDKATVKVKVLDVYYYDHAGYGDGTGMFTNKYQVTFNGVNVPL